MRARSARSAHELKAGARSVTERVIEAGITDALEPRTLVQLHRRVIRSLNMQVQGIGTSRPCELGGVRDETRADALPSTSRVHAQVAEV